MTKHFLAGLLALPAIFLMTGETKAQAPGCTSPSFGFIHPCPNYGCGGFCMNLFGRIHQHGPLFNYGPYSGYYPFEPYGPWTANLCYNPPIKGKCHDGSCGDRAGWGRYAIDTFKNVLNRVHGGLNIRSKCAAECGSCSSGAVTTSATSTGSSCAGCTSSLTNPVTLGTASSGTTLAPAAPVVSYPTSGATGVLTGQTR